MLNCGDRKYEKVEIEVKVDESAKGIAVKGELHGPANIAIGFKGESLLASAIYGHRHHYSDTVSTRR